MRKTKIICTIGPASEDPAIFRAMCLAGLNVVWILLCGAVFGVLTTLMEVKRHAA